LQLLGAKEFATQKKKRKFRERERERELSQARVLQSHVQVKPTHKLLSSLEQMAES
jgi:hypothetical protein